MTVSFAGVGEQVVTMEAVTSGASPVTVGSMVKLSGNGKVEVCTGTGAVPIGVVQKVEDGMAAVQIGGYMRFPCDSDMAVGFSLLALDAAGDLAAGSAGRPGIVLDVDGDTCGVIFS